MTTTQQIRPVRTATPPPAQDQHRLALLWKAFEDAEERIRELERELDRRAQAPASVAPAPAPRDDAPTLAAIARLEETMRATTREREMLRAELLEAKTAREDEAHKHAIVHARLRRALDDVSDSYATARAAHIAETRRYQMAQGIIRHERERAEQARAERNAAQVALQHALAEITVLVERANAPAPTVIAPAPPTPALAPVRQYPVTLDRVSAIPGIREDEIAALRRFGINLVDALLYAELAPLARATDIGLPRLWKLHALAQLMSLHGIGADSAERLFAAGIRSVDDVANAGADRIERILRESYVAGGTSPETIALLAHTLPGRAAAVVDEARRVIQ